ncbi:MAG: ABC transporter ATP-binding protein [Candidatus Aminicenantes bacterium]|nr:ABC transporter ATP-binding protein [Candidatus Aminicenantes bacterium]MBL7083646.1 ABC transporter ATP-binding protein [Candidatus Aminicenantes bacterium]
MTTVLTIKDLHKSFNIGFIPKKRKILKGISLSVEQGEIFGYLGPNGAGKTTTIKCILGLILPQKGKIEIFGNPHLALKAKEKIGFLPENPYFYDHLTASEFLDFYSQLYVMDKNKKEEKIKNLLQLVGLEQSAGLQLRKFSRGMMQRIGLAQALLNDPSLVFLDEPLGGLDPVGRKEIRDIIARLKEEGKTVFLCSHILQDIEMICDRVAIIVNGKIINQGALQDLISEKTHFTEVVFSGVDPREFESLAERLSDQSGRTLLKVFEEENVQKVLELIQSKKGKLHSLIPRTETLEDLFMEVVKQK